MSRAGVPRRRRPRLAASWLSVATAATVLSLAPGAASALALPGDLDTSFGGDGQVTTSSPTSDVAVQPDGKIVATGTVYGGFSVTRYQADGSLDASFGDGGRQTAAFVDDPYDPLSYARAPSIALQADGRIVVAGSVCAKRGQYGACLSLLIALARFTPDGHLDGSFSDDGIVTSSVLGFDGAKAVAIQADGRIVVAGFASSGLGNSSGFAILRYTSEGAPDASFDLDGQRVVRFTCPQCSDHAEDVALQPDGKILVAGSVAGSLFTEFAVARLNGDGTLDSDFAGDGRLTGGAGPHSSATAIDVQADGKPVVAGFRYGSYGDDPTFMVMRYLSQGSLDPSFSGDGRQATRFVRPPSIHLDADRANDLVIQPDGAIVVGGGAGDGLAIARYLPSGSLDGGFSSDGRQLTPLEDFPSYAKAGIRSLALQPDGDILAIGTDNTAVGSTLVRYRGGRNDTSPRADVAVDQTSSPQPIRAGSPAVLSMTVRNKGPAPATAVELFDDFPDVNRTLRIVSSTASQGRCETVRADPPGPASKDLRCELGTLEPGASATVIHEVVPSGNAGERFLVSAIALSAQADPNTDDNEAVIDTRVGPPAPGTAPTVRIRRLVPRSGRRCTRNDFSARVTIGNAVGVSVVKAYLDRVPLRKPSPDRHGRFTITPRLRRLSPGPHVLRIVASGPAGRRDARKVFRRCR